MLAALRNIRLRSSCRPVHPPRTHAFTMKRAASSAAIKPGSRSAKKPRVSVPDYHLTPSIRDENGQTVWPAPEAKMEAARRFILDWCA